MTNEQIIFLSEVGTSLIYFALTCAYAEGESNLNNLRAAGFDEHLIEQIEKRFKAEKDAADRAAGSRKGGEE